MAGIGQRVAVRRQYASVAVTQLKIPEHLTNLLSHSSAAKQFIETLAEIRLQQFERKVERYQETNDPTEAERLRHEISQELFGA